MRAAPSTATRQLAPGHGLGGILGSAEKKQAPELDATRFSTSLVASGNVFSKLALLAPRAGYNPQETTGSGWL